MSRGWRPSSGRAAVAVLAVLLAIGPRNAVAETIRIAGTGGAMGTMRLLGAAFRNANPDVQFAFTPGMGTSGAVKAVLAGRLDIGLCSRPLTDEERAGGAVETRYSVTPLVFGVNRFVKTGGMTLAEVAEIYSGTRDRWKNRTRIRLILRPEADWETQALKSMSPEMSAAVDKAMRREGMIVAIAAEDAADAIENTPGAFGALTLSIIVSEKRAIRALALDGIAPSARAVTDGSYPYRKTFCMATTKNRRTVVRRFMEFVLSPAGAAILAKNGQAAAR